MNDLAIRMSDRETGHAISAPQHLWARTPWSPQSVNGKGTEPSTTTNLRTGIERRARVDELEVTVFFARVDDHLIVHSHRGQRLVPRRGRLLLRGRGRRLLVVRQRRHHRLRLAVHARTLSEQHGRDDDGDRAPTGGGRVSRLASRDHDRPTPTGRTEIGLRGEKISTEKKKNK